MKINLIIENGPQCKLRNTIFLFIILLIIYSILFILFYFIYLFYSGFVFYVAKLKHYILSSILTTVYELEKKKQPVNIFWYTAHKNYWDRQSDHFIEKDTIYINIKEFSEWAPCQNYIPDDDE